MREVGKAVVTSDNGGAAGWRRRRQRRTKVELTVAVARVGSAGAEVMVAVGW